VTDSALAVPRWIWMTEESEMSAVARPMPRGEAPPVLTAVRSTGRDAVCS